MPSRRPSTTWPTWSSTGARARCCPRSRGWPLLPQVDDVAGADSLTIDDQGPVVGDVLRRALESMSGQLHAHAPSERHRQLAPARQDPNGRRPRSSRPAARARPPAWRSPSQVAGSGALPRPELSLHGMQIHRAVVLVAMMLIAVGALVLLLSNADGKSLVALAVVVLAAIAGGIGFSWKRYYRR